MFLIVMGVSGSGKTTVGRQLAQRLGWPFYEGDDYHSPANVAKMAAGTQLDDQDRQAWLQALAEVIRRGLAAGEDGVLACSALKKTYRAQLRVDSQQVQFVYLRGSYELIRARMQARDDHYMKADLLQSQFATLEEPEEALVVGIEQPVDEIVAVILAQLRQPRARKTKPS